MLPANIKKTPLQPILYRLMELSFSGNNLPNSLNSFLNLKLDSIAISLAQQFRQRLALGKLPVPL